MKTEPCQRKKYMVFPGDLGVDGGDIYQDYNLHRAG